MARHEPAYLMAYLFQRLMNEDAYIRQLSATSL